jgi:hypothetical protein
MKKKNQKLWYYSLKFLFCFRSLSYDSVPLALLLLRDYQKYLTTLSPLLLTRRTPLFKESQLQSLCHPYLIDSQPNIEMKGYTLVRAELSSLTENIQEHESEEVRNQQFLYVAHRKKEYYNLLQKKHCRPLIYFPQVQEANVPLIEEKRVNHSVSRILCSSLTPAYFKTKSFKYWLRKKLRHTLSSIRKAHFLFKQYPISKTIYGSTLNRYGVLITSFAQSRRILTINIQHGILGEVGHLPLNADLHLVWGKSEVNYLTSYGAARDKVKVVGPCFIRRLSPASNVQVEERSNMGRDKGQLHILVALQPLGHHYNKKMIQAIETSATPFPGRIRIYYKLHPDQGTGRAFSKHISNKGSTVIPHNTIPLTDLLQQSDVVITPFSSVAYEALLNKKPVIYYGSPHHIYYLKNKPLFVKTPSTIQKVFHKALNDSSFLPSLQSKMELADPPHGSETVYKRIWEVIEKLDSNEKLYKRSEKK